MRTRCVRPDPIPRSAFAGFCFPPDVIVLAVRWYLRFGLSYRDVEELLAERGIEVDHVIFKRAPTVSSVRRLSPGLGQASVRLAGPPHVDGLLVPGSPVPR